MTEAGGQLQERPQAEQPSRTPLQERYRHYTPFNATEKATSIIVPINRFLEKPRSGSPGERATGIYREEVETLLDSGRIPPFLRRGLTHIEWIDQTQSDKLSDLWGHCIRRPDKGFAYIQLFRVPHFDKYANAFRAEQLDVLENPYIHTLAHELGHNMHALLSEDQLQRWESAIAEEQLKDTDKESSYVRDVAHTSPTNPDIIAREDLADSFRRTLCQPGFFDTEYPQRYNTMKQIILDNCESDEERQAFLTFHESLKEKQKLRGRTLMSQLRAKFITREARKKPIGKSASFKQWYAEAKARLTAPEN